MNQDTQIVEQNGIRGVNMSIIKIYESEKNTIWHDGKTFLSVFDKKNKQIADYDFSTGLKIIQDEDMMTIFINSEDLVSGRWKFFGTKVEQIDGAILEKRVEADGVENEVAISRVYAEKDPWNKNRLDTKYVSVQEREKRIDICRSCKFFNSEIGECKVNDVLMVEMTKHKVSYCPKFKWGNKEKSQEILTDATRVDEEIRKEQDKFNEDLEKYLEES